MEGGDFFGDFVDNVSLASHPVKTSACGGYGVNIVGKIFPKVMLSRRQLLVIYAGIFV